MDSENNKNNDNKNKENGENSENNEYNKNTFTMYSLHNIENYKQTLNYTTNEILQKYNLLMIEFLKFMSDNINLKNNSCNKFIIIRGLETISHVFNNILYYTKNIDLAFYHSQKAFYFYVEFISQITDDQHTFLQLNSRDASLFVYKKTIFEISHEYRKNINKNEYKNDHYYEQLDILYIHSNIIKSIFLFFINKTDFISNQKKDYIKDIINKTEYIINKINDNKLNKKIMNTILVFVEQLNKDIYNIEYKKYFEIVDLLLKKIFKGKNIEIKILENIFHTDFDENLKETSTHFISWLTI